MLAAPGPLTWLLLTALLCGAAAVHGGPAVVRIDFARPIGRLRPLHGVNKGPLAAGGLVDVGPAWRALGVPVARLHDCHWPNPDVVDMHVVFPDPAADPEVPGSYDFRLTDEYLAAIHAAGASIVYRLGESIEHTSVKRFVHPPRDPERWARAALGIIRHVNEGWAGGTRLGVRTWEVWNEPENRPAMWSGTDEDYFRLYGAAARAIQGRYPGLKVGGPSVGYTGRFVGGRFEPSAFVTGFLDRCRSERLPLDFFSWHCYTDDPAELVARAKAIRRLLDERGFSRTESHLNEWNLLPGGTWEPGSRAAAPGDREAWYGRMAGAEGAAFVAGALLALQDAPVDVACLFHGEVGPFGLFTQDGVPQASYHAVRAFHEFLATPRRAALEAPGSIAAGAGLSDDGHSAAILLSQRAQGRASLRIEMKGLPWAGRTRCQVLRVDGRHALEPTDEETVDAPQGDLALALEGPCVCLVTLRPARGDERKP